MSNSRQTEALTLAFALALLASCRITGTSGARGDFLAEGPGSFYGKGFDGKRTASGESFDKSAMTAAHPRLPFGSCVRVEVVKTGRSCLSEAAFGSRW